jgi:CubicO group peptidase (beta-lactamase class C family)
MDRLVLKPLGLDACFNWTSCSDAQIARAITLYDETGQPRRDDLKGKRPPCPIFVPEGRACDLSHYVPGENGSLFSPQGGLRISMHDLAKIGQMLLRNGQGFLPQARLRDMQRPAWRYSGRNGETEGGFFCSFGLGVHRIGQGKHGCSSNGFADRRLRFGHAGEAYGLRAGLWIDPKSKTGTAFFTSAVPDAAPKGPSGFYQVEEMILQSPFVQPDR